MDDFDRRGLTRSTVSPGQSLPLHGSGPLPRGSCVRQWSGPGPSVIGNGAGKGAATSLTPYGMSFWALILAACGGGGGGGGPTTAGTTPAAATPAPAERKTEEGGPPEISGTPTPPAEKPESASSAPAAPAPATPPSASQPRMVEKSGFAYNRPLEGGEVWLDVNGNRRIDAGDYRIPGTVNAQGEYGGQIPESLADRPVMVDTTKTEYSGQLPDTLLAPAGSKVVSPLTHGLVTKEIKRQDIPEGFDPLTENPYGNAEPSKLSLFKLVRNKLPLISQNLARNTDAIAENKKKLETLAEELQKLKQEVEALRNPPPEKETGGQNPEPKAPPQTNPLPDPGPVVDQPATGSILLYPRYAPEGQRNTPPGARFDTGEEIKAEARLTDPNDPSLELTYSWQRQDAGGQWQVMNRTKPDKTVFSKTDVAGHYRLVVTARDDVTDNSYTFTQPFTVADIANDAPTAMSLDSSAVTLDENSVSAQKLATVTFTDPDTTPAFLANSVVLHRVDGIDVLDPNGDVRFEVRNGNELWAKAGADLWNHEVKAVHTVTLRHVPKNGERRLDDVTFTLRLRDVNEAPEVWKWPDQQTAQLANAPAQDTDTGYRFGMSDGDNERPFGAPPLADNQIQKVTVTLSNDKFTFVEFTPPPPRVNLLVPQSTTYGVKHYKLMLKAGERLDPDGETVEVFGTDQPLGTNPGGAKGNSVAFTVSAAPSSGAPQPPPDNSGGGQDQVVNNFLGTISRGTPVYGVNEGSQTVQSFSLGQLTGFFPQVREDFGADKYGDGARFTLRVQDETTLRLDIAWTSATDSSEVRKSYRIDLRSADDLRFSDNDSGANLVDLMFKTAPDYDKPVGLATQKNILFPKLEIRRVDETNTKIGETKNLAVFINNDPVDDPAVGTSGGTRTLSFEHGSRELVFTAEPRFFGDESFRGASVTGFQYVGDSRGTSDQFMFSLWKDESVIGNFQVWLEGRHKDEFFFSRGHDGVYLQYSPFDDPASTTTYEFTYVVRNLADNSVTRQKYEVTVTVPASSQGSGGLPGQGPVEYDEPYSPADDLPPPTADFL